MRNLILTSIAFIVTAIVSACSSSPLPQPIAASPLLPPDFGNGIGGALGNYGGQIAGEAIGPEGQHCRVFNWDRPLTKDFAIRYSSLSCDQDGRGWKTTTIYTRSVIPMAQSNFNHQTPGD